MAIPAGMIDDIAGGLLARHPKWWSAYYVDHPERLPRDITELLVSMSLVRRGESTDGELRLTAIAARYAPDVVEPPAPESLLSPEDL